MWHQLVHYFAKQLGFVSVLDHNGLSVDVDFLGTAQQDVWIRGVDLFLNCYDGTESEDKCDLCFAFDGSGLVSVSVHQRQPRGAPGASLSESQPDESVEQNTDGGTGT